MGGYANLSVPMGGSAYQWRQAHGYNNDLPTTPPPDPDYYLDPSITANIRDAQARGQAAHDAAMPFSPEQMQNALQLWQTGQ